MTGPSVVLVTVDSIRADHVGHLGYDRATTPVLDRLADSGTVCPRAYASGIPTYYSFKSLLGGLEALGGSRGIGVPAWARTLAERFAEAGYRTAGFNAGNPWLTPEYGYDRGFDTFRDFLTDGEDGVGTRLAGLARRLQPLVQSRERVADWLGYAARTGFALVDNTPLEPAETVTEAAVEWLEAVGDDRPVFLWVHYMDPHYPWVPRSEDVRHFRDGSVSKREIGRLWHAVATHEGADGLSAQDMGRIVDLYDAELRRTDRAIGWLLEAVDDTTGLDQTVVGVVGDHGTELGDHGGFSHGPRTLYEEVIRVPLVFAGPSVSRCRLDGLTSLVDVPVTLLDAAGVGWDPDEGPGRPVSTGGRQAVTTEVVYDYEPHTDANRDNGLLRACVDWPWKLIVNDEHGTRALYNLERDPDERTDRTADNLETVSRLEEQLQIARRRVERHNETWTEKQRVRDRVAVLKDSGRI